MTDRKETYLGDGCYASFDGFAIWLRAPREEGDHFICLEPEIFDALLDYAQTVLPAGAFARAPLRRENLELRENLRMAKVSLAELRTMLEAQMAPGYKNASFPERACDYCGKLYRGPAVYCSLECAKADGSR